MKQEDVAEAVAGILVERELMLGTVECGVAGAVSRRLFNTAEGPLVLGNSLVVEEPAEAITIMELPRPQFKKAGEFSMKAARAGARQGCAFLGVQISLAIWGQGPTLEESLLQPLYLAVDGGRQRAERTVQVVNEEALAQHALTLVWEVVEAKRSDW
ncbi:MAG TPA: hypothetical protein G4N98_03445 [Thermoflexia bacterium]|nr:hypothetical protein [Thermoflexia bacterium]